MIRMLLMTSLVVGVVGALARFELAPEVAGFKMHALGVALMLFAVIGLVASLKSSTARWTQRFASPLHA